MIRWLAALSLAAKLRVIVIYAAGVALTVAAVFYVSGSVLGLRQSLGEPPTAWRRIPPRALSLQDKVLAAKVLDSLRADPNVRSASVYDANGKLFATLTSTRNRRRMRRPRCPPSRAR